MKTEQETTQETKPCAKCKGTGQYSHCWVNNTFQPGPCDRCGATGLQARPDTKAILALITKENKATGKRSFRKSKPDLDEYRNILHGQAYYVWRMVRFHSGNDVTMPVCASSCVRNDSWIDLLDTMADLIAAKCFGTNIAAAYRWGNALGHSLPVPDNMPASAHSCGPVADEHKPESELAELI